MRQCASGHCDPDRLAPVVGSLLILINQWEAIIGTRSLDRGIVALTCCVPYVVSTYTSAGKDIHQRRLVEEAAMADHEARNPEKDPTR